MVTAFPRLDGCAISAKDTAVRTADLHNLIERLGVLACRPHAYCEDSWYSCPKAEDGCANEAAGDDCNCGADKHNAEVAQVLSAIRDILPE